MGRLAGFRHRQIVRKLKRLGFEFDRWAAGSHEIWFNPATNRYTTVPNHPGDLPEGTLRAILRQAGVTCRPVPFRVNNRKERGPRRRGRRFGPDGRRASGGRVRADSW